MRNRKTTTDHAEIQRWTEVRNGRPAQTKKSWTNETDFLKINFSKMPGEDDLKEIPWDQFFEQFEERELEFVYENLTADGKVSRFYKFIKI